ncbi:MAG: thioredoxin family protein [Armatimonadota bacterium]
MRPIRICLSILLAAGLFAATLVPVYAQDTTITDAHQGIKTALEARDYPTVWRQSHAILDAAARRTPTTLTGPELYAMSVAHYYLVAETLDQALKMTGLTAEQVARGTAMRDQIMGVRRQPAVVGTPAVPPAAAPATPATPAAPAGEVAKIRTISRGQEVRLEDYAVPGKTTIFDFTSEFCGPCRMLSPRLEKLVNSRDDLLLVKVDINRPGTQGIDWQSPVARQYSLRGIPHLKVYGTNGALQAEGDPAYQLVNGWISATP